MNPVLSIKESCHFFSAMEISPLKNDIIKWNFFLSGTTPDIKSLPFESITSFKYKSLNLKTLAGKKKKYL